MVNEEMRRHWSDGAEGWVQNESLFDAVFAPVTQAILDAAGITAAHRVLDVGCGTGTLLEAGVGAGARVVGVDISAGMVRAAQARVPEATVLVADAQQEPLLSLVSGGPFDRVVSRFGVMFFADPVAAFANLHRAAADGARLTFACWRGEEENPMFSLGTTVLTEHLEQPPTPTGSPASPAPGPTSLADREHLAGVLTESGWSDVRVEPLDFTCDYGTTGSDGVEERLAGILGTSTGRRAQGELEPRLGPAGWESLLDEVRAELHRHLVDGVVRFPGATWLVTAAG